MLTKEIKKPMTAGVILYGIAFITDILCVMFQRSVFEFMNGFSLYRFDPVFPLITVYHFVILLLFTVFWLIMHKYKGSSRWLVVFIMTIIYCAVIATEPFIGFFETYLTGLFGGENDLAALSSLNNTVEMFTLPFTTVSAALIFIAAGRYGISANCPYTSDVKLAYKIPMLIGVALYGNAVFIDLLSVVFQQDVYKKWNGPTVDVFVFPLTSVLQIIFMMIYIAFLLTVFIYRRAAVQKACIVLTVIFCVYTAAIPFIRYIVSINILNSFGEEYMAASITLENFIELYTAPFTAVSAVFLFIALGRYGMIKKENNAEMLE